MKAAAIALFLLSFPGIRCDRASWRDEWTRAQAGRIAAALSCLDRAGLGAWAEQVRETQRLLRFHNRACRQWGYDAGYDPDTDEIWLDPAACDEFTAEQLGAVLLNEAVHRGTPGNDTKAEHDRYYGELLPAYKAALRAGT